MDYIHDGTADLPAQAILDGKDCMRFWKKRSAGSKTRIRRKKKASGKSVLTGTAFWNGRSGCVGRKMPLRRSNGPVSAQEKIELDKEGVLTAIIVQQ